MEFNLPSPDMMPPPQQGIAEDTTAKIMTPPLLPSGQWRMLADGTRADKLPKGLDAAYNKCASVIQSFIPRTNLYMKRAAYVLTLEDKYKDLSDARLKEAAMDTRATFRLDRQTQEDVAHAFAIVREVAWRQLQMKPYQVQVAAAMAMYDGCIAELATGEGKTLTATMPSTVAAWRGRGCHVITVNDYLAERDAEEMSPVYKFCGLNVAHITGEMHPMQRKQAYLADVTYLTNKEVTADFLRDQLALGHSKGIINALLGKIVEGFGGGSDRLVMRGVDYAVIDEADSVLIDEAVTPLIISGSAPNEEQIDAFETAAKIAKELVRDKHYKVDERYREVNFTVAGREKIGEICEDLGGIWKGIRRREEMLNQALVALNLYTLGKQYVIQEEKIVIVDEFTGRLMPDRSWRDGLHQAVEAKEGLEVQPMKETMARVSFQRFFRLYKKLAGMTGTAYEGRFELWQIYNRPTVRIPTNKPRIRIEGPTRVFMDADSKWNAIAEEVKAVNKTGRPILIGTRSVQASEYLSGLLEAMGVEHQVLNAVKHEEEAHLVAQAGQMGMVTVATNMAGRGTDIKLGRGVREIGGLHVILTERHESGRIDRQLYGRAGRQGDPGSTSSYSSLDDEILVRYARRKSRQYRILYKAKSMANGGEITSFITQRLVDKAQRKAEKFALRQRKGVLRSDDWLDESLGFTGYHP